MFYVDVIRFIGIYVVGGHCIFARYRTASLRGGRVAQPTAGPDLLWGSFLDDMIDGRGGDDQIHGYDGYDTLNGPMGMTLLSVAMAMMI